MAEAGTQVFRVSLNPKLYRDIEITSSKKLMISPPLLLRRSVSTSIMRSGSTACLKETFSGRPSNTNYSRTWPTWTSRATPVVLSGRLRLRPSRGSATR
jgi:hypothetical protein